MSLAFFLIGFDCLFFNVGLGYLTSQKQKPEICLYLQARQQYTSNKQMHISGPK